MSLNLVFMLVGGFFPNVKAFDHGAYQQYFYISNLCWLASITMMALYQSRQWLDVVAFMRLTLKTFLLAAFMIFMFVFAYKYPFSRLFVFSTLLAFAVALMVNRILFHFVVLAAANVFMRKAVIIGSGETARKLMQHFKDESHLVRIVGVFGDLEERRELEGVHAAARMGGARNANEKERNYLFMAATYPFRSPGDLFSSLRGTDNALNTAYHEERIYEGRVEDCLQFVRKNEVSDIYCTLSPEEHPEMYELAYAAEKYFVHFKFVPDYTSFVRKSILVDYVGDLPLLSLRKQPLENTVNRLQKRALDLVVSALVIVFILSWLVPLLAILIKMDSEGPVFFRQLRSGKNNKPFWCIKFRTLRQNPLSDQVQVTRDDSRVTKLGAFLRKTNLDEMPQFLNVLLGHMSVVGPRPHMLKHTEEFYAMHKNYMIRHFVKPGVTGLAQVNGFRGEIRRPELLKKRVEHDIMYLENWSLMEDVRIILKTIFVSLRGDENAY